METWLWHDEGRQCVVYILTTGREVFRKMVFRSSIEVNQNQMEAKDKKEEEGVV